MNADDQGNVHLTMYIFHSQQCRKVKEIDKKLLNPSWANKLVEILALLPHYTFPLFISPTPRHCGSALYTEREGALSVPYSDSCKSTPCNATLHIHPHTPTHVNLTSCLFQISAYFQHGETRPLHSHANLAWSNAERIVHLGLNPFFVHTNSFFSSFQVWM